MAGSPQENLPRLSVVVPTYHEAANVAELADRLFKAIATRPELGQAELILVDDNSNDGIDRVVADGPYRDRTKLIVRTDERGLASAVLRGLAEARGEVLVVMDADLSHPPEAVPDLVAPILAGKADMVVGSRYAPGGSTDTEWSWFRRVNSRVATWLARPFAAIHDPMSGFFALPAPLLRSAGFLNPTGYKIALELMVKCRCRHVAEVPIHFADRQRGQSKLTMGEQVRYVEHLSRLYDFRWPHIVPVLKFLIVTALGLLGAGAWFLLAAMVAGGRVGWAWWATAYWPAIAINLLAYWRYIKQMKGLVPIRRPVFDFVAISGYEWLTFLVAGAGIDLWLGSGLTEARSLGSGWLWPPFFAAFFTRFLLRKLARHDIRGLPARQAEAPVP
ncbi:MAG: polyprenol monophosphomannose synthase [Phycisphaerae bacterium]|nr:polyprenol monophosphomannose synthase [Phycisphaerae bacterium]